MQKGSEGFIDHCTKNSFLQIWSHLLKKSLMENFTFCVVDAVARAAYKIYAVKY